MNKPRTEDQKSRVAKIASYLPKLVTLHPLAFGLFPVLSLISQNVGEVAPNEGFWPAIYISLATAAMLAVLSLVLRNVEKAAAMVSVGLIVFFSYGRIYDFFTGWHIGELIIGRHLVLKPVLAFLFYCYSLWLAKKQSSMCKQTHFLGAMGLALIIFTSIPVVSHSVTTMASNLTTGGRSKTSPEVSETSVKRDIYYIILDGYASASTLKERYGYDNSEFLKSLVNKGFYVASRSRSNYAMTHFSLASSLNMQHLTNIRDAQGENSKDISRVCQMAQDSEVVRFLKSQGYKYVHFQSGFGLTDYNENADVNIQVKSSRLNRFSMMLLKMSILQPLTKNFIANDLRNQYVYTFYQLAEMPKIKGPKFVFAHLVLPHPPFVFARNGEPVKEFKDTPATTDVFMYADWEPPERYVDQLAYTSKRIDWVVGQIIANSKTKPIIILQADHGPSVSAKGQERLDSRPFDQRPYYMKARAEIFNAYYMPGGKNAALFESITPVNTFRVIFNEYFKTNYEPLPDITYYSTYSMPFKFTKLDEDFFSKN